MAATSQDKIKFNDYEGFAEKFKPKKTTDDCYTPPIIYNAVANWVANKYNLDKSKFARPFYPNGDYKNFDYSDLTVVDNPPFSILKQIVVYYTENNIKFFLFSPTLAGLVMYSDLCTALVVGVDITYENGAVVTTSFITNLEPHEIRMKTDPSLYHAVHEANKENTNLKKKQLPKYVYPLEVASAAAIMPYSKYDIEYIIPRNECERIRRLDAQKETKKTIFGCGLLLSDRLTAERKKAERKKAEREKALCFKLSERERNIIAKLSAGELDEQKA